VLFEANQQDERDPLRDCVPATEKERLVDAHAECQGRSKECLCRNWVSSVAAGH